MNIHQLYKVPASYLHWRNAKLFATFIAISYVIINRDQLTDNPKLSFVLEHFMPVFVYLYVILVLRKIPIKIEL